MTQIGKLDVTIDVHTVVSEAYGDMVKSLESPPSKMREQLAEHPTAELTMRLLHATMGCVTESGELMDQMKRLVVYGKELDVVNYQEELGDILWYIQLACNILGTSIPQLMIQNAEKLKVRFGDRFDFDKVLNRDLDAERQALEANQ